jgi:hypothetical protein
MLLAVASLAMALVAGCYPTPTPDVERFGRACADSYEFKAGLTETSYSCVARPGRPYPDRPFCRTGFTPSEYIPGDDYFCDQRRSR